MENAGKNFSSCLITIGHFDDTVRLSGSPVAWLGAAGRHRRRGPLATSRRAIVPTFNADVQRRSTPSSDVFDGDSVSS